MFKCPYEIIIISIKVLLGLAESRFVAKPMLVDIFAYNGKISGGCLNKYSTIAKAQRVFFI